MTSSPPVTSTVVLSALTAQPAANVRDEPPAFILAKLVKSIMAPFHLVKQPHCRVQEH